MTSHQGQEAEGAGSSLEMIQRELCLMSLVESAEIKLKRQQQAALGAREMTNRPAEPPPPPPSSRQQQQQQQRMSSDTVSTPEDAPTNEPVELAPRGQAQRASLRPEGSAAATAGTTREIAAALERDKDKIDGPERTRRRPSAPAEPGPAVALADAERAKGGAKEEPLAELNHRGQQRAQPPRPDQRHQGQQRLQQQQLMLQKSDHHQQQQQQQQQQRKESCEGRNRLREPDPHGRTAPMEQVDDQRGGPTPTNDLIRALLGRDRLAFGAGPGQAGAIGPPGASAPADHHRWHTQDSDGGGGRRRMRLQRSSQVNNEIELSADAARFGQALQLSDNNDTCRKSTMAGAQAANLAPAAGPLAPPAAGLVNCAGGRAGDNNDGPLHGQRLDQPGPQRRHSTYMLPLLLSSRRRETSESESDDDSGGRGADGDEQDNYEQKEAAPAEEVDEEEEQEEGEGEEEGREQEEQTDDECAHQEEDDEPNSDKTPRTVERAKRTRASKSRNAPATTKSANTLVSYYHALRTSASSPSNLNTPTNEIELGRGGCGGSCCSGQGELLKLAYENANPARYFQAGTSVHQWTQAQQQQKQQQQMQKQQQGQLPVDRENEAGRRLDGKQERQRQRQQQPQQRGQLQEQQQQQQQPAQQQQQQQVMARHRAGSNPLDRVRRASVHNQTGTAAAQLPQKQRQAGTVNHGAQLRLQLQQLQLGASNNKQNCARMQQHGFAASKRHSIINLISGANLNATHKSQTRRSFAACAMGLSNYSTPGGGNGGDLGSNYHFNGRRLTSGAELLSAHLGGHEAPNGYSLDAPAQQQQQPQYDPLIPESGFKIVVMGTSGSGKTSIIQRFLYGTFTARHQPTVEDTYFIEFPYKKNLINISVSDTSGTYQFPAMRRLAINSGDAFILVYSVDDPQSFDCLEQLRQTILEEREQAYLESVVACGGGGGGGTASCPSDSSSTTSSSLALAAAHQAQLAAAAAAVAATTTTTTTNAPGTAAHGGSAQVAGNLLTGSLTSTVMNHDKRDRAHHNQLHPDAKLGNSSLSTSNNQLSGQQHQQQQDHNRRQQQQDLSPSRHWSLASLFSHHSQVQPRERTPGQTGAHYHHHSSIGSSICSSSSCSSADNSRRSSISAAEAALRTRRTRRPPMVIVANKHDLPRDKHLVNSDEIEALAVIDWNNGFVRASAALNWNIDEIFQQVLMQARQPPTLSEAIVSKRRKSLPPKLPHP